MLSYGKDRAMFCAIFDMLLNQSNHVTCSYRTNIQLIQVITNRLLLNM